MRTRSGQKRRALQHEAAARDRGQLWLTTPGAICAHALQV